MSEVKVHHKSGCSLCGSKEPHTHSWEEWERHVHGETKHK